MKLGGFGFSFMAKRFVSKIKNMMLDLIFGKNRKKDKSKSKKKGDGSDAAKGFGGFKKMKEPPQNEKGLGEPSQPQKESWGAWGKRLATK
ncbi:hypothetical protein ABW20_dc0109301 [Dactylellina cionopaga]|nr:hypothetical protein ABW20_dc0109301 [Dactylellina cionopaga]